MAKIYLEDYYGGIRVGETKYNHEVRYHGKNDNLIVEWDASNDVAARRREQRVVIDSLREDGVCTNPRRS